MSPTFFLKRYNWNVNTHLELSRFQNIFFAIFCLRYFFFDWRTQSASHWLCFKVSLVMVQTTLFMNFSSKKKNPLLWLYFKIIDDFLKNTWRDYHYKCSSKDFIFLIHAFQLQIRFLKISVFGQSYQIIF